MAILQVSRITQRKGLQEDLPQPLASAELGWSLDQRRLFIGNGTIAEGAPVVGNTEILTEFSDILAVSSAYTYQGQAGGYTVQTGSTPGTPVSQSLQSRLDSFAVVTDFGATGDGVTDDTAAINRALYQLYCVQVNPQIRRGLFFPAGVYRITDTILIPPYARLYGDGSDASIILFETSEWVSGTAYVNNTLVKNYDAGGVDYYRSLTDVPALIDGLPVPLSDATYWEFTNLPPYAFNTSDSLQQTGSNIGLNGASPPQYIELEGMSLATAEYLDDSSLGHNVLLLDRVNNSEFNQCSFYGPLTKTDLDTSVHNLRLVDVESTLSYPVKGITFDQCSFHNATYAFNTDQATQGVTISNSVLDTLYQGVVLGSATVVNGGPTGVRIMHNTFDNIFEQGVVIDTCSLNATGYNAFYDVGNHFLGITNPQAPCILINANNNISVGDVFARTDLYAASVVRIQLYNVLTGTVPASITTTNGRTLQMGTYQRQTGSQQLLADSVPNQVVVQVNSDQPIGQGGYTSFRMDYTIYRTTAATHGVRTGCLVVCASPGTDSAGEKVVYTDDYQENENCDVTLTVSEDSSDIITVYASAAATGYDGVIYYSLSSVG